MQDRKQNMIEEIGKIRLNLEHYPGEDYYCDGEIEDELLDIVRNYSEAEYQRIIEERRSWPVLYHLSAQRENIVEWLPIDKSMKVLEIGAGCGAITGALSRKAGEVTCIELSRKRSMINAYRHMDCSNVTIHVGNFQDIESTLPCDYDYICLIGVFEYGQAYIDSKRPYEDFLSIVSKHRKENGHIVIAIENKLGLKYWAGCKEDHLGTWFDSLEDYQEGGAVRTFTRDGLLKIAENCGFSDVSMYYPYPDYKFMTSLYSDKRLPKTGELSSNLRNFDRERMRLFDEKLVFDTLIKEGQFPLFSNSYMMILGPEPDIKYAKYSNDRADAYKIKTLVTHHEQDGNLVRQIEKHALSNEAHGHIMQMKQAYEDLSKRFEGGKLLINRCSLAEASDGLQKDNDGSVYAVFEYLEGRTLEELLDECLKENDMEKFQVLFDEYLECISYHDEMAVTDYDLIFSNILVSPDGGWNVIDYEWTFAKKIETKEIAFRAVYCYLLENEKRNKLDFDSILSGMNVSQEDAEHFRHREKGFQKYVTARKRSMIEIRDIIGQPVHNVEELIEEKVIKKQKGRTQIYEDMGEGFSEQNSFFPDELPLKKILKEESYTEETLNEESYSEDSDSKVREFRVKIKAGRKALRLDPCSDSCVVWLKEIKWNDAVISPKSKCLSANGFRIGDSVYAFDTEDPGITIQLSEAEQRQENFLQVSMQVTEMPKETVSNMYRKEPGGFLSWRNKWPNRSKNGEKGIADVDSLKQSLKRLLINKQHKWYQKEVVKKNLTYYDAWIRAQEEKLNAASLIARRKDRKAVNTGIPCLHTEITDKTGRKRAYNIVSAETFEKYRETILEQYISDITVITMYDGKVNDIALPLIDEEFRGNDKVVLIYGDEDIWNGGVRKQPWLKPDWSPDGFLSCLYFGGLIAVRTAALTEANMLYPHEELYMLLFEVIRKNGGFKAGHDLSDIPVCHIPQVLFHSMEMHELKLPDKEARLLQPNVWQDTLISVIIPSKDNPDTLFKCLDSLFARTATRYNFEVILVDNGSSGENRRKIEEWVNRTNCRPDMTEVSGKGFSGCRYLYKPMPFNFSVMCNMGAEESKGDLLLFLNDDMEIIQSDWLDKLADKAVLPYAGAVGAKLLYPDSHIIQHAGITNLRVGPAHKLQFLNDEEVHYYGKNRGVHNVLAVTGACLMVRRNVFEQAGGFPQELAVAFNDVDLCYSIYEKGYYNIVRNDVTLYHHESLSRGHDGESEEKQMRLMREKDALYERHRELYGKDPFYHPYLTTDRLETGYTLEYNYHMLEDMPWSKARIDTDNVEKAREDKCLVVGMECAMDIYKWKYGVSREKGLAEADSQDLGYFFQGYSFVIGADNACYKKKLLMKNKEDGGVYSIPVENRYRQDIRDNLKDQENVELTGFAAKVQSGRIPAGTYRFGMMAEDMCSRQKLVNWSSWVLEVKDGL